jgi:hypothetical protein
MLLPRPVKEIRVLVLRGSIGGTPGTTVGRHGLFLLARIPGDADPGRLGTLRGRASKIHDGMDGCQLDPDTSDPVLGCRLGLGDDHRDRLACEHDLIAREWFFETTVSLPDYG